MVILTCLNPQTTLNRVSLEAEATLSLKQLRQEQLKETFFENKTISVLTLD